MVYGGDRPIAELRRSLPDLKGMSRRSLKACLLGYIAYGWTGVVPSSCARTVVLVPSNVAPWLWGWPNKLLARMDAAHSETFVLGPYHGGQFSSGIDTIEALRRLPAGYGGGIWTDEIELIAPAVGRARPAPH